jgi:aspartyl/asparaginyl beta-hydroxylase (cupin superfamily)
MERLERVREAMQASTRRSWDDPIHDIVSPFPLQRPSFYYPGLDTRTFHDTSQFGWISDLRAAFPAIRRELDGILRRRAGFVRVFDENTGEGEWGAYLLSVYGMRVEANTAVCPDTMRALDAIPGVCGFVCFSAIAPQTHILPHCGLSNVRLRCHLPLKVPQGCRLRVGTREVAWREGEPIVFDDSFEHEVWNPSNESRIVLMFDVLHPNLTIEEEQFVRALQDQASAGVYGGELPRTPAGDWVYA